MRIATVGVYGSTFDAFLEALRSAGVTQVLDVRQRRGVRGSEYAWANAQRLQAALQGAAIEYRHHKELAPTTGLRQLQYAEDDRLGSASARARSLVSEYVRRYTREVLGQADLQPLVEDLPTDGIAAILCVERDPEACHRSLLAERLAAEHRAEIVHLRP